MPSFWPRPVRPSALPSLGHDSCRRGRGRKPMTSGLAGRHELVPAVGRASAAQVHWTLRWTFGWRQGRADETTAMSGLWDRASSAAPPENTRRNSTSEFRWQVVERADYSPGMSTATAPEAGRDGAGVLRPGRLVRRRLRDRRPHDRHLLPAVLLRPQAPAPRTSSSSARSRTRSSPATGRACAAGRSRPTASRPSGWRGCWPRSARSPSGASRPASCARWA